VLLDEPTNALDADGLALLAGVFREEGRTWVVATHEPERVEQLATQRLALA
jgi:ATPase subunit of ABC transporter with duplicated ATPase domains